MEAKICGRDEGGGGGEEGAERRSDLVAARRLHAHLPIFY
jgi:hypothetical protein